MSNWTTERGDEWWYSDLCLVAEAGMNIHSNTVTIGGVSVEGGLTLSKSMLHRLLGSAHQEFEGCKVFVRLSRALEGPLNALLEDELVKGRQEAELFELLWVDGVKAKRRQWWKF